MRVLDRFCHVSFALCLSVCLSVCLSLSLFLSFSLFFFLSFFLSFSLSLSFFLSCFFCFMVELCVSYASHSHASTGAQLVIALILLTLPAFSPP